MATTSSLLPISALWHGTSFPGARLRQTGGMCVALHVPLTATAIPCEAFLTVLIDEGAPIDIHPSATRYRFIAEPCLYVSGSLNPGTRSRVGLSCWLMRPSLRHEHHHLQ